MDSKEIVKTNLQEKIRKEGLVPDAKNPGSFIAPGRSLDGNIMGFLYPENWVFHKSIVDKVLAGDYEGIRPYSAEFVPTLNCTNRCRGPCSYVLQRMNEGIAVKNDFKNPRVHMQSTGFAKMLLDKLVEGGIKGMIFTGGGEPTLFKGIEDLLLYASQLGVDSVLYTNGNCVSEKRARRIAEASPKLIRVSFNCGTEKDYNDFHNPINSKTAFYTALRTIKAFAEESLKNPAMNFGVGCIMNQDNWQALPETAKRLREIVEQTGGGISSVSYRPAFNYCGPKQTPPEIVDRAYELVETEVRKILSGSGITVTNIKCRYETLKGEERGYSLCRASGLFAELGPSGELHSCCDRNCFKPYVIGDLTKNSLEEIYSGKERKEVMDYANDYGCATCAIACKPHETNKQFEKIEQMRERGEMHKVEAWIDVYQKMDKPAMVNF